jgi:hypothetical protein
VPGRATQHVERTAPVLNIDLYDLVTPDLLDAYRRLWSADEEAAAAEAREIVAVIGKRDTSDEKVAALAKIIIGLHGPSPDLNVWLEAIAVGDFELRPAQEYATSRLESDARFFQQREGLLDPDVATSGFRALQRTQDGIRLIAASLLLKELRRVVAPLRAMGPAWPLLLAVMTVPSKDNKFRRRLHQSGGDERLIRLLRIGVWWAVRRYVRQESKPAPPAGGSAAAWRTKLPVGAEVERLRKNPVGND